jgi:glycerol-1-phosphatase
MCEAWSRAHIARRPRTDISYVEGLIPQEFGRDAVEIAGARDLLSSLDRCEAPWAVVTSGTRALATGWIEVMKLAHPKHMVVAEDVELGKPDPACYLLGRKRLGLEEKGPMLVIEDAPSGIRAGKSAGFRVVGLATTHTVEEVKQAGADWIIRDLRDLTLQRFDSGLIQVVIRDSLVM